MLTLVSVNVSAIQRFRVGERLVATGILKRPIAGRAVVRELGVDGDAQADHRYHGGREKAVYLYSHEHYEAWRRELDGVEVGPGVFGENLTLAGVSDLEAELRVGDELEIGGARLKLTDPRIPCWKLETRMGIAGFARRFLQSARLGLYARVLREGEVGAGDPVAIAARADGAVTYATWIRARYFGDAEAIARSLEWRELPARMRRSLESRAHP